MSSSGALSRQSSVSYFSYLRKASKVTTVSHCLLNQPQNYRGLPSSCIEIRHENNILLSLKTGKIWYLFLLPSIIAIFTIACIKDLSLPSRSSSSIKLNCLYSYLISQLPPNPSERREAVFGSAEAKSTTGEVGRPEDVAESYLYVMRDRKVTGSVIDTNGGCLLTS